MSETPSERHFAFTSDLAAISDERLDYFRDHNPDLLSSVEIDAEQIVLKAMPEAVFRQSLLRSRSGDGPW